MREISDFIFSIFVRLFSDDLIKKKYLISGAYFGIECIKVWGGEGKWSGLKSTLFSYSRWEREFARRGYRTLHFYYFFTLSDDWRFRFGEKREPDEEVLLYSDLFTEISFPNSLSELNSVHFDLTEERKKVPNFQG